MVYASIVQLFKWHYIIKRIFFQLHENSQNVFNHESINVLNKEGRVVIGAIMNGAGGQVN